MKFQVFALAFLFALAVSAFSAVAADSPPTSSLNVSLVNQNPDPARAGETLELRFMVENNGGTDATNVQYELVPKYPFTAIPGEVYTRKISTISAYQNGDNAVIMKFTVMVDKDAVKGTNEIGLRRLFEGSGTTFTTNFDIEVRGTEFAQIIYVDKAKLYPGNETPLTFTITNVGNSPLRDLVFSWSEENGVILPVYSDDTKYVKNIDVGESVEIEYTVVADVNAVQGLYQLDLKLQYETETGVAQELNTKAGIFVGGETDFDVTFSESSAGVTSLSLANVGNNPAYSVTVRIPDQPNYRVTGSTSTIVGNLDKGDYTIVSFQISQAAGFGAFNASQSQPGQRQFNLTSQQGAAGNDLIVDIDYTDTTGSRHSVEKHVPIQFMASSSDTTQAATGTARFSRNGSAAASPLIEYAILGAVAVALAVGYRKRKRLMAVIGRKKKKV